METKNKTKKEFYLAVAILRLPMLLWQNGRLLPATLVVRAPAPLRPLRPLRTVGRMPEDSLCPLCPLCLDPVLLRAVRLMLSLLHWSAQLTKPLGSLFVVREGRHLDRSDLQPALNIRSKNRS